MVVVRVFALSPGSYPVQDLSATCLALPSVNTVKEGKMWSAPNFQQRRMNRKLVLG